MAAPSNFTFCNHVSFCVHGRACLCNSDRAGNVVITSLLKNFWHPDSPSTGPEVGCVVFGTSGFPQACSGGTRQLVAVCGNARLLTWAVDRLPGLPRECEALAPRTTKTLLLKLRVRVSSSDCPSSGKAALGMLEAIDRCRGHYLFSTIM